MISIIIPAYNGAKFLKNLSLPSLRRQTFNDWEATIVDDGSNDNTAEVVREFAAGDGRIKYLKHENNRGLAAALNSGFKAASGDIVCFLEQDDGWLQDKLAEQMTVINTGAELAVAKFFTFNPQTKRITGIGAGNFSTLMFKKNFLAKLFPLPEDKKFLGIEDGILAARLILATTSEAATGDRMIKTTATTIKVMTEPLVLFARHRASLSGARQPDQMIRKYRAVLEEFKNKKSPALKKLKRFWRTHLFYNQLINCLPLTIRKILYATASSLNYFKNWAAINKIKKHPNYAETQTIIKNLNLN